MCVRRSVDVPSYRHKFLHHIYILYVNTIKMYAPYIVRLIYTDSQKCTSIHMHAAASKQYWISEANKNCMWNPCWATDTCTSIYTVDIYTGIHTCIHTHTRARDKSQRTNIFATKQIENLKAKQNWCNAVAPIFESVKIVLFSPSLFPFLFLPLSTKLVFKFSEQSCNFFPFGRRLFYH